MPALKTIDEHRTYLQEIVRLKLWFLWHWLQAHADEPFEKVLRERVDIYRKLALNPGGINPSTLNWDEPRWLELETQAKRLYLAHREDECAAAFEEDAFALFRPQLDARAPRDFADRSGLDGYTFGSIRFDPPADARSTCVSIHIANAIAPHSIFADPAYLPDCLREMMRRAETSYGADTLGNLHLAEFRAGLAGALPRGVARTFVAAKHGRKLALRLLGPVHQRARHLSASARTTIPRHGRAAVSSPRFQLFVRRAAGAPGYPGDGAGIMWVTPARCRYAPQHRMRLFGLVVFPTGVSSSMTHIPLFPA